METFQESKGPLMVCMNSTTTQCSVNCVWVHERWDEERRIEWQPTKSTQ